MKVEKTFAWQSLLAIVVMIAVLIGVVYWLAGDALQPVNELYLLFGAGLVTAIVLWLIVRSLAGRLEDAALSEASAAASRSAHIEPDKPVEKSTPTPKPVLAPAVDKAQTEAGAVQMLAILQRKGRLVDFLQEDLGAYEDVQIGAAVRSVHAGCRQALDEHMQLESIYSEAEGSQVTVDAGFDAYAVRLSGNVSGEPPFTGTLQHSGWRAVDVDLPKKTGAGGADTIIAAADVEVVG